MVSKRQTRTFPGRYDQIREICEFVVAGAEQAGLDKNGCFQIELACDEACTNVIEHTYAGEDIGELTVGWRIEEAAFAVTIQDSGKPFDPQSVETTLLPDKDATLDDVPIGGLGLRFIRQLVDDMRYAFTDGNELTLVKWLPVPHLPVWQRELAHGISLVGVRGRLDQALTTQLEQVLGALLGEDHRYIIVDLSETAYINSGGLRSLVTTWRKARQKGGDLVLCGLRGRLVEIFEMIGFDKFFRIYPDASAARLALSQSTSSANG